MALTVSNNGAVAAASYYLGKNQDALQTSIKTTCFRQEDCRRSTGPWNTCCFDEGQCSNQPVIWGTK